MGLKFVRDETERVLRSVGDPPNGIVGLATEGEQSFVEVTGSWEPTGRLGANVTVSAKAGERVATEDAIAACHDVDAASVLFEIVTHSLHPLVEMAIEGSVGWPAVRGLLDLAEEVDTALSARFP